MQADDRLNPLWNNRENLNEAEWTELYKVIVAILKRSNPSILRSLPEGKAYYIQDFFVLKVFEPAKHNSATPHGANQLCSYFNNYLIDVYRGALLRTTDWLENYDDVGCCCGNDGDDVAPHDGEFFEYGYSHQDVHQRAQGFLAQLDEIGRLYLALHACDDVPEPLYKLAERLHIPSYHYRALSLGITRKKGEYGDGYESTQIGGWLTKQLGLELAANTSVLTALKILCFESLLEYQENGSLG